MIAKKWLVPVILMIGLALAQVFLCWSLELKSRQITSYEEAITGQEEINRRLVMTIARRTSLEELNRFARQNQFVDDPERIVIPAGLPVAYGGRY